MPREDILNEMLDKIDNSYDKSKGSIPYDILNAAAIKLAEFESSLNELVLRRFGSTAKGKYLQYVCMDSNVVPKTSTKSTGVVTISGLYGSEINKGIKVGTDTLTFSVTEKTTIPKSGVVDVKVECDTYGTIGNVPVGAVKYFPMTITGLRKVINSNAFTGGYDGENEDELRARFFEKVQKPVTSGNANEYKLWAKEVTGVGDAKVFPLWNGANTVKVVLLSSDKMSVTTELIDKVKNHIEEQRPIGATVTIASATEKKITVSAKITMSTGVQLNEIKAQFSNLVSDYLKNSAFTSSYISIAKIGNLLLSTDGVLDYSELKTNNQTSNISLSNEEVAVLDSVTLEVI